jgi:hypothetical protein
VARELKAKVEDSAAEDTAQLAHDPNEVLMSPLIFTEITDPGLVRSPLFKLDDLFLRFDEIPLE